MNGPDFIEDDEPDLGPDERDADLLDGSWEHRYYAGRIQTRDWRSISVAISILILLAFVLGAFATLR
ncbi:MAG TPA: hypothetical protein VFY90_06695 [Tepidiformaceae bacterium]|nr:hypothetical protein [Tepidiformaceae bacterium]